MHFWWTVYSWFCFYPETDNICRLIELFRPLIFNVSIDKIGFKSITLVLFLLYPSCFIISFFFSCLLLIFFCFFFKFLFKFQLANVQCNTTFRCTMKLFINSVLHPVLIITSALLNPSHLFHPSSHTSSLVTISLFSIVKSLCLGLPPSLSLSPLLFLLFLKFHIWVKSYGICLSFTDLFHIAQYSLALSTLSQMARFHSFYG